ncbi:anaphase promoting complex subunit doc1 [Cadophora gregata]|uniref:anaphase promoting complex subunit doc1 n=1 Tax=Cadophora gregata TaxID=51156 RepID=UPI0026DC44F1|nr:anaphase promoting complex subunit doc1 [Cadophora gregata]KAK0121691.1 anaphase promoting complex subunit doc1 [Cadophora gregata]KAK0127168.1 anaphase promoting complex subunit doc1 [Cadophora gregata f. sp. sojae]
MAPQSPSPRSASFLPSFRLRPQWAVRNGTPPAQSPVNPRIDTSGRHEDHDQLNGDHEGLDEESDIGDEGLDGEENGEEEGEEEEGDEEDEEGAIEEVPMEIDSPFDPAALGLKEIGNLASWTVSSCKPGCGVDALRDDDTGLFWQSDGPQPHHLNIHFSRLVSILSIRIFLDFEADESYTPTRITLLAGTGYHDLIPFAALNFEQPKGWLDVPLDHVGGGPDGKTLRAFLVQVRIVENHQNGKDTHVRGLKIYARDDRARAGLGGLLGDELADKKTSLKVQGNGMERTWLIEPDWMGEPELR